MKRIRLVVLAFLFSVSLCGCRNNNDTSDSSTAETTVATEAVPDKTQYQVKMSDSPGNLEMIQSIYPSGDDFYVPGYGETEKYEEAVRLIDIENQTSEDILICSGSEYIISSLLYNDKIYICFSDSLNHIKLRIVDKKSKKTEKESELKFDETGTVFIRQIFIGKDGKLYILADLTDTRKDDVNKNSGVSVVYSVDDEINIISRTVLNIPDDEDISFSAQKILACEDHFWMLADKRIDFTSSLLSEYEASGKIFSLSQNFEILSELKCTDENYEDVFLSNVSDFGIADDGDLYLCTEKNAALSESSILIKYDPKNLKAAGQLSSDEIEKFYFSSDPDDRIIFSDSDGNIFEYDFHSEEKKILSDEKNKFTEDLVNAHGCSVYKNNMLLTCMQEEIVDSVLMYRLSSDGKLLNSTAVSSAFEDGYSDRIYISDEGFLWSFEKTQQSIYIENETYEFPGYVINRFSDGGEILNSADISSFFDENCDVSSDALYSDRDFNNYLLCSLEGKILNRRKLIVTDKFGKLLLDADISEKYEKAQFIKEKGGKTDLALLVKNKIILYNIDIAGKKLSESRELELISIEDNDRFEKMYQGRDKSDIYLMSENGSIYGYDLTENSFTLLFDSSYTESIPDTLEISRVFPLADDKIVFTAYDEDAVEKICILSKNN